MTDDFKQEEMKEVTAENINQKKKFRLLGFRSGKLWKKIIASIFYGFFGLFVLGMFLVDGETENNSTPAVSQDISLEQSAQEYQKGIEAFNAKNYDQAELSLEKVISEDPNYNDAQTKLTEVYLSQGATYLDRAKNLYNAGNLNNESAYDDILSALHKAVEYNPELTEAKEMISTVATARQEFIEKQKEQEVADFKNSCKTYEYKVLNKNPDSLKGENLKLKGKIMQIQEDSGETFMLVEVTNLGYDVWSDTVAVYYLETIDVYEDDIITIYGTVTGAFSYTSQAGWEITVPGVLAQYINI